MSETDGISQHCKLGVCGRLCLFILFQIKRSLASAFPFHISGLNTPKSHVPLKAVQDFAQLDLSNVQDLFIFLGKRVIYGQFSKILVVYRRAMVAVTVFNFLHLYMILVSFSGHCFYQVTSSVRKLNWYL